MTDEKAQRNVYASRVRLGFYEIDLIQVFRDIWGAKYLITILACIGVIFAIISLGMAKPTYTAVTIVSQSEGSSKSGVNLGQYASAAAAIGINLGANSDDTNFLKFKVLLDSDLLSVSLFQRDDIKPFLFGPGWDAKTRTFVRPSGLAFESKEILKGILGLRTWSTPGPTEVRAALKRSMSFTADKLTGLVKISVQDYSPQGAVFLLRTVVSEADSIIRRAEKEKARDRIRYLDATLSHTTMQDQRDVIINLLSSQQRSMMMASVDKAFAIEVIDPAYASSVPTSPVPRVALVTYVLSMIVIGVFLAIFYGLTRIWAKDACPYSLDQYLWRRIRRLR